MAAQGCIWFRVCKRWVFSFLRVPSRNTITFLSSVGGCFLRVPRARAIAFGLYLGNANLRNP